MSTSESINLADIPDHVETSAGGTSWRLAGGRIVCGRQNAPEFWSDRNCMTGVFERVGIHDYTDDQDRPGRLLEVELLTKRGRQTVNVKLVNPRTGGPTIVSSINLAAGILAVAKGELIQIETKLGTAAEAGSTPPTYVNVTRLDPKTFAPLGRAEIGEPKSAKPDRKAYLEELIEMVEEHPAFAARPSGPSHQSELAKLLAERGWPNWDEAPQEWEALVRGWTTGDCGVHDLTDDQWGDLRQKFNGANQIPKLLQPALERAKANEEWDPFAEE